MRELDARPFASDVARTLVVACPQKNWLPQAAVAGPFAEFDFHDDFGMDPRDRLVWVRLFEKRTPHLDQRLERAVHLHQPSSGEASAHVSGIDEAPLFVIVA